MPTPTPFPNLQGHQYMNLTTYRKTGAGVTTPVWFAEADGKLYVYTQAKAGKIKRLRNNNKVEIGPCDRSGKGLGATQPATARILSAEEGQRADQLLTQKYGWLKRIISFVNRMSGRQPNYIEVRAA